MSKRPRVDNDATWYIPYEVITIIIELFVGGIRDIYHIHASHRSLAKKWSDREYLTKLLESQKEKNLQRYLGTKCARYLYNFCLYGDIQTSFTIIYCLLSSLPSEEVVRRKSCCVEASFILGVLFSNFLSAECGVVDIGTKTYPKKSSPLSTRQNYIITTVYKYIRNVYGWVMGIRRDGNNTYPNFDNFSGIYLEHEFIVKLR